MLTNLSFISRNKSSVFLLILALIVGGVGAQATSLLNTASGGYLICVNSKTKVVTHPGTSRCPKGNKKVILGVQGQPGSTGITGAAGIAGKDGSNGKDGKTLWNGVKDPESMWGAPGDMFINATTKVLFGPKNLDGSWPAGIAMVGAQGATGLTGATGVAGPSGPQGPGGSGSAGATGAVGATGASSLKITELFICGAGGISLCKVGVQGPGGGTIFFVDYNDIYTGFNYLEAAPISCEWESKWASAATAVTAARGWAARAVGSGSSNTAAIKAVFTEDGITNNAAYWATSCRAGSKSDWFLGSLGEMKLMYDNLQGVGGFVGSYYWSSTESDTSFAWTQYFELGYQVTSWKRATCYVLPVRSF